MAAVVPIEGVSEGEALGDRIAELNAYLNVAQAEFLELLREFDEKEHWAKLGFPSCAHWLNFKCGIGFNAARERLRIARALGGLPEIRSAFAEGRVSFSKVRAMTRVAKPENEDMLLNIAYHGTADHVERYVSQYRRIEKLQDPAFVEDRYRSRAVNYYYDGDGCLVIHARIPAEQGEVVIKALERAIDSNGVHALSTTPAETTAGREPIAARRADALCEVAETYLNRSDHSGSTADRYQVVVHMQSPGATAANTGAAQLENGPCVSAETSARLSCDCCVTTIEEDAMGEPLNIGRRSRTIPPPMRRALQARDGGCRFPGCNRHKFCDGHHIKHWQDGGETSLDNLVLLCRHHHRLVHEGGFDCRESHGEVYFVDRRERRLEDYVPPASKTIEETLAWLYRRFDTLDGSACSAQWDAGQNVDWDHAMMVAFQQPADR